MKEMDELFNADSARGYEPLTDEEKEAMGDKEIERSASLGRFYAYSFAMRKRQVREPLLAVSLNSLSCLTAVRGAPHVLCYKNQITS